MKKILTILTFCLLLINIHAQAADDYSALGMKAYESMLSGSYSDAIAKFQYLYDNSSNTQDRIAVAQGLATSYIASGKYKEAEFVLLKAKESFGSVSEHKMPAYREIVNSLSLVYLDLNNYDKANNYIQEAKDLFEENLDFGDGYVRCLSIMAGIQVELGYKTLGRMLIDVAVRQAKTNYENLKKNPQSTPYVAFFKEQTQRDIYNFQVMQYAQILSNAAATYERMGYMGDAVTLIKEAISVSNEIGVELSYCYSNLADIYLDKSKYREAVVNYEKALSLAKTPYESDHISMSLSLAKIFAKDKDVAELTFKNSETLKAHQQYAFTFLSENERQNYWENSDHNIPLQNYIYQKYGNDKYNGQIYDNLLYSKGLLLRATNEVYDKIIKSVDSKMLSLYRRLLQTRVSMMNEKDATKFNSLKQRCDSIDKILVDFSGKQDSFSINTITWKDIQSKLNDGDIAIEFYSIPNINQTEDYSTSNADGAFYCAATIKKGYRNPHIVKLLSGKDLAVLTTKLAYKTSDLFNAIWKPLSSELQNVSNIYFSADRDLHKIAIESLSNEKNQTANSLWNIYRLSSTREIMNSDKGNIRRNFALFGGLDYNADVKEIENCLQRDGLNALSPDPERADSIPLTRRGMSYLPGTKIEVETIQKELEGKDSISYKLYIGLNGTEEALKSLSGKNMNVIHLSTHGFFWTKPEADKQKGLNELASLADKNISPLMRSGILMTGANHILRGESIPNDIDDGIATALELSNLDYRNVDLVVLSACQTALGDISGEGVYGLQRGLKLAGINSILMTLWPVADQATQRLMTEFYKNLLQGDSKSAALKKAQDYIKSQKRFEDPRYWAGFILLDGLD